MNLKLLEKYFKNVTDKQLQKEIDKLDENLATIKSPGTTVIDLKVFRKIRDTQRALVAVLEKRSGLSMSSKTDELTD